MDLPLKNGQLVKFYRWDIEGLQKDYPGVDVEQEFAHMRNWLDANPRRRPVSNMKRFVVSWLKREQKKRPRSGFYGHLERVEKEAEASRPRERATPEQARAAIAKAKRILGS